MTSRCWCWVSFGFLPIFTPRALARSRPSPVRAWINALSDSASPPSTASIKRPCAVVLSAHVSPRDRNPAFFAVIAATVFKRSRVDRASLSRRVTSAQTPRGSSPRSSPTGRIQSKASGPALVSYGFIVASRRRGRRPYRPALSKSAPSIIAPSPPSSPTISTRPPPLARLHQLNAICAILGASDRDKSLDLRGLGLRKRL